MRYAGDFVAGFQFKEDARAFYQCLPERLGTFALCVEPTKTGMHAFSRHGLGRGGNGSLDFLGCTFRWQRDRTGRPHLARETSAKKFKDSIQAFGAWIKKARYWPRRMLFASLRRKWSGYVNYYGVAGNSFRLHAMWSQVYFLLYKWLNRCSQRRSYTMAGLTQSLRDTGIIGLFRVRPSTRQTTRPFLWTCT